jgi:hypothetical protein
MLVTIDTASACHRFSRWYYPYRQSCRVTALAPRSALRLPRARINVSLPRPAPPHVRTPPFFVLIPLPDLANIDWGHPPDDDTRGRLLLRVILQGKEDR